MTRKAQLRPLTRLAHRIRILAPGCANHKRCPDVEAESCSIRDHGRVPHGVALGVAVVAAAVGVGGVVDAAVVVELFAGVGVVDIAAGALHVVDAVVDGPLEGALVRLRWEEDG